MCGEFPIFVWASDSCKITQKYQIQIHFTLKLLYGSPMKIVKRYQVEPLF